MADYLSARAAIAFILGGVAITVPATVAMAEVHQYRPDAQAVNGYPCAIITGYTLRYSRGPSGKRERIYGIGLRLAVRKVANDDAALQDILDAMKEAVSSAFDSSITLGLGGSYLVVSGPNWNNVEPNADGAGIFDEGEIVITIKDTVNFAA